MRIFQVINYILTHPANKNKRINTLLKSIGWQVYKRIKNKPIIFNFGNDIQIKCWPGNVSTNALIYTNGKFDYHEINFLEHYLKKGDGFLDIGGNCGVYSFKAASILGESSRIDCFEPDPTMFYYITESKKMNKLPNLHIHKLAVSETKKISYFSIINDSSNHHLIDLKKLDNENISDKEYIKVDCVDLDSFVGENIYSMAKMDIEGAEFSALMGAKGMLSASNPPVWLVEINPEQLKKFACSAIDIKDFFKEHNYSFYTYNSDLKSLKPLSDFNHSWLNVFAISDFYLPNVLARIKNS